MMDSLKALTPLDGFKYLTTKEYTRIEITVILTRLYIALTKSMHAHIEEHQSEDITNELFFLGECILILQSDDTDSKLNSLIEYYTSPQYIGAYLFRVYNRYCRIIVKYRDEFGSDDDVENELWALSRLIEVFNGVYEAGTDFIAA